MTLELSYTPIDWIDKNTKTLDNGNTVVAYVLSDDWYEYEMQEGVELEEFRTQDDRDDFFEATDLETHVPYIVDHFEHSGHHFSLSNTESYPHSGWDTRPSVVLRVPVDFTDTKAAAKSILEEYSAASNGEVYTVVREEFNAEGELLETDMVGGFVGTEYVEEVLTDIDSYI